MAILLAMAMFVLVVDTSLMNVSISAVITDLDTTASGVQSAIALEALVSAAFILINSKVGDLIGRKRAYVIGLSAYALGALAMTLAQSLTAVIVFWAIIGGLGASLLLPAMQSLIHGNFERRGPAEGVRARRCSGGHRRSGRARSLAASSPPTCLGGSASLWRSSSSPLCSVRSASSKTSPTPGSRKVDVVGAVLSVVGMGGVVLGILVWQEGGEFVGLLIALGSSRWRLWPGGWYDESGRPARRCSTRTSSGSRTSRRAFRARCCSRSCLGGAMIALPLFLQMTLEYNAMQAGLSLAPLSLSMFAMAHVGRQTGWHSATGEDHPHRVHPRCRRHRLHHSAGAAGRQRLVSVIPLIIAGSGLGLLVSQLNNYTLAPVEEERVSEAAGVNSAAGSFGLSFGLAVAGGVMLAVLSLSFTRMTESSTVIPPAEQQQVAATLEDGAEVMSNTQLDELITEQPPAVEQEILAINEDARNLSLQVALAIPLVAALLGTANSFRMLRLPDLRPSAPLDGIDLADEPQLDHGWVSPTQFPPASAVRDAKTWCSQSLCRRAGHRVIVPRESTFVPVRLGRSCR